MSRRLPLLNDQGDLDEAACAAEYRRLVGEYGYDVGVSIRVLLDHDYKQGAQLRELIPDQRDLAHEVLRHSFIKGASA
jgi:hypothetical protein